MLDKEFSFVFVAKESEDYYFTIERISLDAVPMDVSIEEDKVSEDDIDDGKVDIRFEGEMAFLVTPKVYDITYAKDWERGTVTKVHFCLFDWHRVSLSPPFVLLLLS